MRCWTLYELEARIFKALGDETRLQILGLLRLRELCVCELAAVLPVSQPAVSQHLRRLREAGLVRERRRSYWTYYALREDLPDHVATLIQRLPESEALALVHASSADACAVELRPAARPGAAAGKESGVRPGAS